MDRKWGGLFWSILLIVAGVVFLLDSLEIITVNAWGLVSATALILVGLWLLLGGITARDDVEQADISIPLDSASRATVRFHHGAGQLQVNAGTVGGDLITGSFGGGLDERVRRVGGEVEADLRVPKNLSSRLLVPGLWRWGRTLDWTVGLSPEIPLALEFETGAGKTELDLTKLLVNDLRVQTGASSTQITLPENAGLTQVKIGAGAAEIGIRVPETVAASIRIAGALSDIQVDEDRFPRMSGGYQSADYETAPNRTEITIEMGVGSVRIR